MSDDLISFRLSEPEIEALKAHSLPDESLGLAAKRLVRQMLQVSTVKSTDMSTTKLLSVDDVLNSGISSAINKIVEDPKIDEKIEALLEEHLASYISSVNQKFKEQEERIESLEKLKA